MAALQLQRLIEISIIYRTKLINLSAFMRRQLRIVMNVTWRWGNKITNVKILRRGGLPSMTDILIEKNLRWLGNVDYNDWPTTEK